MMAPSRLTPKFITFICDVLSRFYVSEIVAVKNYMKKVNPVRHSASQSLNLVGQTRNLVRHASGKFSPPIITFGSRNLDSALESTNSANPYIFPILSPTKYRPVPFY